jgi:hypothetical protein
MPVQKDGRVVDFDHCSFRKLRKGSNERDFSSTTDGAILVELGVNVSYSNVLCRSLRNKGLSPDIFETLEAHVLAIFAWAVANCEGRGFVEEEELRITVWLKEGLSVYSFERRIAGNPCSSDPVSDYGPAVVVQDASITEHGCRSGRVSVKPAPGIYAILQRHSF